MTGCTTSKRVPAKVKTFNWDISVDDDRRELLVNFLKWPKPFLVIMIMIMIMIMFVYDYDLQNLWIELSKWVERPQVVYAMKWNKFSKFN